MKSRLSLDRFEGDKKQVAVLLCDDGSQVNLPKGLLPKGAKAGDVLSLSIERDVEATRRPLLVSQGWSRSGRSAESRLGGEKEG